MGLWHILALHWKQLSQIRKHGFARIREQAHYHQQTATTTTTTTKQAAAAAASIAPPTKWKKYQVKVESMLLCIVVFTTYEYVMNQLLPSYYHQNRNTIAREGGQRQGEEGEWSGSSSSSSSVAVPTMKVALHETLVHSIAGGAAGISHSLFWFSWECLIVHKNWNLLRTRPKFCLRTILHHSVGYSALFGSYSFIKHSLLFLLPLPLPLQRRPPPSSPSYPLAGRNDAATSSQEQHNNSRYDDDDFYFAKPVISTFLSGGCAGLIHYIVNHYTSHWRVKESTGLRGGRAGYLAVSSSSSSKKYSTILPKLSSQKVIRIFLPMACSFTAYEYGQLLFEEGINYGRTQLFK